MRIHGRRRWQTVKLSKTKKKKKLSLWNENTKKETQYQNDLPANKIVNCVYTIITKKQNDKLKKKKSQSKSKYLKW